MSQCEGCGSFVTKDFARVFGDDENRVHACLECMTATDVKKAGAAGEEHPRRRIGGGPRR